MKVQLKPKSSPSEYLNAQTIPSSLSPYQYSRYVITYQFVIQLQYLNSKKMIDIAPTDLVARITEHYQNMKITNKRILAQFRSELRRVNYSSAMTDKDKYQSTCMETINERSKEAEADSFQLFQPRPAQDTELHQILNQPLEKYYQTNQQTAEIENLQNRIRSFQNKLMKSAGWTVDPTRESLTKVEKNTPQPYVRDFCHIYDQN